MFYYPITLILLSCGPCSCTLWPVFTILTVLETLLETYAVPCSKQFYAYSHLSCVRRCALTLLTPQPLP